MKLVLWKNHSGDQLLYWSLDPPKNGVYDNIKKGMEGNFNALKESQWWNQDINYDIGSVMQYGGYGFSANGKPTITYKDVVFLVGPKCSSR